MKTLRFVNTYRYNSAFPEHSNLGDLTNYDDLIGWLKDQPREVSLVISSRAALRAIPALSYLPKISEKNADEIIISVFRGAALAWTSAIFPKINRSLVHSEFAADSARATSKAVEFTKSEADAVTAATRAADFAAFVSYSPDITEYAADAVYASESASGAPAYAADEVQELTRGLSSKVLAHRPLWPNHQPENFQRNWHNLKGRLLAFDKNWVVWTDWFDNRINGIANDENLERSRVELPDEIWSQGHKTINSRIQALTEDYFSLEEMHPKPTPSVFSYRIEKGKISAQVIGHSGEISDTCLEIYNHVKKKALSVKNSPHNKPVAKWLVDHVEKILASLGTSPAEIKPGLLLIVEREIDADYNTFESERGRQDVALSDLRLLGSLKSTLEGILACLPEVRTLHAAMLALKVQQSDAQKINQLANEIIEQEISMKIVNGSAIGALRSRDKQIERLTEHTISDGNYLAATTATKDLAEQISFKLLEMRGFLQLVFHSTREKITMISNSESFAEIKSESLTEAREAIPRGVGKGIEVGTVSIVAPVTAIITPLIGLAEFVKSFKKEAENAVSIKKKTGGQKH